MMLSGDKKEHLSHVFQRATHDNFAFLVRNYGFTAHTVAPTLVRYRSDKVIVNVFHGSAFQLGVEIGLTESAHAPVSSKHFSWWDLLASRSVRGAEDPKIDAVDLQSAIAALVDARTAPSDVRERLKTKPKDYDPWFVADTPEETRRAVRRLADLTEQYGTALLRGDLGVFRNVQEYIQRQAAERTRIMLLEQLPSDVAEQSQHMSVAELYQIRDEIHKQKIIAEQVSDLPEEWRDLPADEFMKRYTHLKRTGSADR
jgi:hypothetical protein